MTLEQRLIADAELKRYGAHLTDAGFIAKGPKVMSVAIDVKGKKLCMVGPGNNVLATYPATNVEKGVSDFVQKFWFWKPV